MRQTSTNSNETCVIPLREAFHVLKILSNQRYINGTDQWRMPSGNDSLATLDSDLASIVQKQPPSKFGHADTPSLWTATHFYLALPALSYAIRAYGTEDMQTSAIKLQKADIRKYFIAFPYITKHFNEYRQFKLTYGSPSIELWDELLSTSIGDVRRGTSANSLIERLPPELKHKALKVLSDQDDSLTGRIILAYILGQGTHDTVGSFDSRVKQYLEPMHGNAPTQTLFERLIIAQQELGEIETYLGTYEKDKYLRLADFLGLVSWYARPHLVEMMLPGLTGAAEPAIRSLSALFDHIIAEGGPDYTHPSMDALPSVQKFRQTQNLESIGRLSIVKDIVDDETQEGDPEGTKLRNIAKQIYTADERQLEWGNTDYYIPNTNRPSGFKVFRQDIANIVYCAGIFTEHNNMSGIVDSDVLKQLAQQLRRAESMKKMRTLIARHSRTLDMLSIDWEVRYAGHERLRLLRFVRQTFGLDTFQPIPISLEELDKGFAGSFFDGHVYHLKYQEAGEKLEMAIPVHPVNRGSTMSVRYRYSKSSRRPRVSPDSIPYSAWLEITDSSRGHEPIIIPVPGRGSFDPFGRVGSPHAGEVIGFGCSVHHASLSIILAELASLGASKGDLKRVAISFMHINRTVHERHDLAAFQVAQIITAFEEGRPYTCKEFLKDREDIVSDRYRPHLAAFVRSGDKSMDWAEPQAARLNLGFPTLYAFAERMKINPRQSWYDGRNVELPEALVDWQVLTC